MSQTLKGQRKVGYFFGIKQHFIFYWLSLCFTRAQAHSRAARRQFDDIDACTGWCGAEPIGHTHAQVAKLCLLAHCALARGWCYPKDTVAGQEPICITEAPGGRKCRGLRTAVLCDAQGPSLLPSNSRFYQEVKPEEA